ncbi:hypothetical protein ACMFMF_001717 [Clarireedia jacksonii]
MKAAQSPNMLLTLNYFTLFKQLHTPTNANMLFTATTIATILAFANAAVIPDLNDSPQLSSTVEKQINTAGASNVQIGQAVYQVINAAIGEINDIKEFNPVSLLTPLL